MATRKDSEWRGCNINVAYMLKTLSVRDNFESKVEDLTKEISDLLQKSFVINFNANEVLPYKPETGMGSSTLPGRILAG